MEGYHLSPLHKATLHPVNPSERTKLKVPQLLEKVAMRSLSKDPEQRYQTMNEVIRLLQQDWRSDLKR